jgi:hypothetical protein
MGMIMISCPSTGRAVSTGIETLSIDPLPTVVAKTICSACGCVHEWTKIDAWLSEVGEHDCAAGTTARALPDDASLDRAKC